ncbi:MAG: cyclophilin family peptidyl-prolyl cis-trans isomerase [Rhodothermales bacterium]|jgi:cyclophilin family peptidyl-prolyl cis-trans isomerase
MSLPLPEGTDVRIRRATIQTPIVPRMRLFLVALLLFLLSTAAFLPTATLAQMPDDRVSEAAPDSFVVAFEASTGPFEVSVWRHWSPAAVDRLYHLVRVGYFDGAPIFRVVKGFVAQFGIPGDPAVYEAWRRMPVEDESGIASNLRGRVSFARGGPQTRTTQIFINVNDNVVLDTLMSNGISGYPAFGEVTMGMAAIDSLNGDYGNGPSRRQGEIVSGGKEWLDANFPGLDWIISARLKDD